MSAGRATLGAVIDRSRYIAEPEIPVPPPGEFELPCDDGEPMESNEHRMQMVLLIQSLKDAWIDHEDFFVGGNMFVYFSEAQVKHNEFRGPDVFVVLGTSRRSRRSWVAWGENSKLPDVVIELLSERTQKVDRGEKMHVYSKLWKTSNYFLFDPIKTELEGYRLDPIAHEYRRLEADARGDLPCAALGLSVGVREGLFEDVEWPWLRWIDPSGQPLPTAQERAEVLRVQADELRVQADELRVQADEQRLRADALEARLRELEAKPHK